MDHPVEVVKVKLEPHPNADRLSIVRVYGYTVVVRTEDWTNGDLGAYIPPDSIVDTTMPEFAYLAETGRSEKRIRAIKLRGVYSQGMLVKAPVNMDVGDDACDFLRVKHYQPKPVNYSTRGQCEVSPSISVPIYDMENWKRYVHILKEGEEVVITEKIHGTNARAVFHSNKLHIGSHKRWVREEDKNIYWSAFRTTPGVVEFCKKNEGFVVYGEIFGKVQSLRYGAGGDIPDLRLAAFDIYGTREGRFLQYDRFSKICAEYKIPVVPELYVGPYTQTTLESLTDGLSVVPGADHIREGVVVKPVEERYNEEIGRVILKNVSDRYLASR